MSTAGSNAPSRSADGRTSSTAFDMSSDFPALLGGNADQQSTGAGRGHLSTLSLGSYATQLGQAHALQSAQAANSFTPDDFPALGGGTNSSAHGAYSTVPGSAPFAASLLGGGDASTNTAFGQANGTNSAPAMPTKLMQEQQNAAAALAHRQGLLGQLGPQTAPQRAPSSAASKTSQPWSGQLTSSSQAPNGISSQSASSNASTPNGIYPQSSSSQIQQSQQQANARVRSPSVPVQAGAVATSQQALPPTQASQQQSNRTGAQRNVSVNLSSSSNNNNSLNGVLSSAASDSTHSPRSVASTLPSQQHPFQHSHLPPHPSRVGSAATSVPPGGMPMPQTPAQQVLFSPADRFGLLGLLQMIKMADPDTSMLVLGQDLAKLGLDLGRKENLASGFVTPFLDIPQDPSAPMVEPEYTLPSCYNVKPPAAVNKISQFTDETLFFIFYTHPRDILQEAAAQALHQKNWRFHKELKMWLTKDREESTPSQKTSTYEKGHYIVFNPQTWEKVRQEFVLVYDHLETRQTSHSNIALQQQQQQQQAPNTGSA